jgi:AraC-like DNA-binding protein
MVNLMWPAPITPAERIEDVHAYLDQRHTDPGLRIRDAALYFGVNEKTIRRALKGDGSGPTWSEAVRERRIATAKRLLANTSLLVAVVARRAGYDSTPSFARAFKRATDMSPVAWRMAHGGARRAGGATGAARKPAQRARALELGIAPPDMRRPWWSDYHARFEAEMHDARTRQRLAHGGWSIASLTEEVYGPRGFGRRGSRQRRNGEATARRKG